MVTGEASVSSWRATDGEVTNCLVVTRLLTVPMPASDRTLIDRAATTMPCRFYRVVSVQ